LQPLVARAFQRGSSGIISKLCDQLNSRTSGTIFSLYHFFKIVHTSTLLAFFMYSSCLFCSRGYYFMDPGGKIGKKQVGGRN
jgi:hypothetical protein